MKTLNRLIIILGSIAAILFLTSAVTRFYLNYVVGNKLWQDKYQTFNVAYILGDDNKWERVPIKTWIQLNAHECQVTTTNDIPIYTSFSNIKLTLEK